MISSWFSLFRIDDPVAQVLVSELDQPHPAEYTLSEMGRKDLLLATLFRSRLGLIKVPGSSLSSLAEDPAASDIYCRVSPMKINLVILEHVE